MKSVPLVAAVVALGVVLGSSSSSAQESQSAAQADAVAAKDADEAGRFVAALFFPGSQLLVISARCASPSWLEGLLARHEFREVYLELGSASVVDSKLFFQDAMANGLRSAVADGVDVVYERDATQTIFDGNWKKHNLSESAYKEKFAAADGRYARLLSELVQAVK